MLFLLLFSALVFLIFFVVTWLVTNQSVTGPLRSEGPKPIGDKLRSRNHVIYVVVGGVLLVIAVLESVWLRFSYAIQDFQALATGAIPDWGIIEVANGSISWAFYAGLMISAIAGVVVGTVYGCRKHAVLRTIGVGKVI